MQQILKQSGSLPDLMQILVKAVIKQLHNNQGTGKDDFAQT